jgi:hypothetical protein
MLQVLVLCLTNGKKAYFTGRAGQVGENDKVCEIKIYKPQELPPDFHFEDIRLD